MNLTHPHRVTTGEIVVHCDEVHAVAGQGVEIGGQRRHQGLALASAHFCHPTGMHGGTTHHLHVVVPLADHPLGCLAHHGEGLGQ